MLLNLMLPFNDRRNGQTFVSPPAKPGVYLSELGFEFDRQAAGSHEIWCNPTTRRYTTIPNHSGDMPEGTLRAILKQADIEPEVFVAK